MARTLAWKKWGHRSKNGKQNYDAKFGSSSAKNENTPAVGMWANAGYNPSSVNQTSDEVSKAMKKYIKMNMNDPGFSKRGNNIHNKCKPNKKVRYNYLKYKCILNIK